ncbi:hypothetical protein GQX74_007072 [Glossina fuscipes]|nr:hypothetical protein GQX74_007072 [Glossina fuscipes]
MISHQLNLDSKYGCDLDDPFFVIHVITAKLHVHHHIRHYLFQFIYLLINFTIIKKSELILFLYLKYQQQYAQYQIKMHCTISLAARPLVHIRKLSNNDRTVLSKPQHAPAQKI